MSGTDTAAAVTGDTRVRLHPLDRRRTDQGWIIGRKATGDFITLPDIGRRAIDLLAGGHTVASTAALLRAKYGDEVDVAGFVSSLVDVGLVAALDGRPLAQPAPPAPSLAWLKPRHVRWIDHPATAIATAVLILAGLAATAMNPAALPGYRDLIWSPHSSLVIAGNAAIAWTIIFCHELAHLATARAAGVPARMSLSTRLQSLAAQTDVSGVWTAPRRIRLTVYLAGMAFNLALAAAGILAGLVIQPHGLARHLLAATVLISLLFIPSQFMVFMRTDMYFVLQDLTGSANLYADGARYLRYLLARLRWRPDAADPTRSLPGRERTAIRVYCVVLLAGTVVCLGVGAVVTLPVAVTLLARVVTTIVTGRTGWPLADAVTFLTITLAAQALWARAWWRRHGHRVRRHLHSLTNRPGEGVTPT